MHHASANETAVEAVSRIYSPLTMSSEWPKMGRLLFMVAATSIGSIMNGFFVASFFVEHTLKKVGNVYLACIGLCDLIITSAIIPTSAVVLLSGEWDFVEVCYVLQVLGEASTYAYSMFSTLVAVENFYRICRPSTEYEMFLSINVGFISVLIFTASFALAGAGVYMNLDYDYCQRRHYGHFYYRAATAVVLYLIPAIITVTGFITAAVRVRRRAKREIQYKRSHLFDRDYSTIALNLTSFIFYAAAWLPTLIVIHEFPSTSDPKYYNTVWLGLFRAVLTSFFYGIFNQNFRRAFGHLFNYCCFKNTMTTSFNSRHRRGLEYRHGTGAVRVHIMHHAISATRAGTSSRYESQVL